MKRLALRPKGFEAPSSDLLVARLPPEDCDAPTPAIDQAANVKVTDAPIDPVAVEASAEPEIATTINVEPDANEALFRGALTPIESESRWPAYYRIFAEAFGSATSSVAFKEPYFCKEILNEGLYQKSLVETGIEHLSVFADGKHFAVVATTARKARFLLDSKHGFAWLETTALARPWSITLLPGTPGILAICALEAADDRRIADVALKLKNQGGPSHRMQRLIAPR